MAQPSVSPFEHYHRRHILLEVGMDDLNVLVAREQNSLQAIGTHGLNGCTCVVILGTGAILLAHISPYDGRFQQNPIRDPVRNSYDHHRDFMERIARLLEHHVACFPSSSTTWGIFCGGSDSRSPVRSIVQQVHHHLTTLGYTMRPVFYREVDVADAVSPKGELVALFRNGVAELHLEQTRLWPSQQTVNLDIGLSSWNTIGDSQKEDDISDGSDNESNGEGATERPRGSEDVPGGSQRAQRDGLQAYLRQPPQLTRRLLADARYRALRRLQDSSQLSII